MLPHKKISILVVDDELSIRESLSELAASRTAIEVETAADGPAALAKIKENHYDIMLIDVKMPEMDGLTLLKKLKESDPDTAMVMMTAHGDIQDAVEAMKAGRLRLSAQALRAGGTQPHHRETGPDADPGHGEPDLERPGGDHYAALKTW